MSEERLSQLATKARHQPLTSWSQCCVVHLLEYSAARLARGDWSEALDAAQRAHRKQRGLSDGRAYADKFLRVLRRMAKERLDAIEREKAPPIVEEAPPPPHFPAIHLPPPALTARQMGELRALYWDAILSRDVLRIQAATRECRDARMAELYQATREHLQRELTDRSREARLVAIAVWESAE